MQGKNGIINILKPPGMTSNGVTVYLRRLLSTKRVGHAGTLDPGAAGVLVVLLGRSTRLSDHLMGHDKVYLAELCFGKATDTLDSYGTVTAEQPLRRELTVGLVEEAARSFLGDIEQVPPAYSAVKIDGRKSYELARKGIIKPKPPRKVRIHNIKVLEQTAQHRFLLEVACTKGTYIRTLLEDIAKELEELAYTSFLMRTCSGSFHAQGAVTLDEVAHAVAKGAEDAYILPPDAALEAFPVLSVDAATGERLKHGQRVVYEAPSAQYRLYAPEAFLGLATQEGKILRLTTTLYGETK